MAERNDGGAEHHLFVGVGDAYIVRAALQPKDKGQDVLQLLTEIDIGLLQILPHGGDLLIAGQTEVAHRDRIKARYPQAEISILPFAGLCSYYGEKGAVLAGFEDAGA